MTYTVTYIEVQPNSISAAVGLLKEHGKTSREEEGNAGVDVLQELHRENRFVIIQAWKDDASFQVHESAERTAQFRFKLRDSQNSPHDQRVHHAFAVGSRRHAVGPGTLFVVTHVDVPPPRREETEILLESVVDPSSKDEGNVRYDVFQQNAPRTNHFTVLAVWNDEKAFAAHQSKAHTRQFREMLGPMLGAPYDERLYKYVS